MWCQARMPWYWKPPTRRSLSAYLGNCVPNQHWNTPSGGPDVSQRSAMPGHRSWTRSCCHVCAYSRAYLPRLTQAAYRSHIEPCAIHLTILLRPGVCALLHGGRRTEEKVNTEESLFPDRTEV